MLFNSFAFAIFLPIVFILYWFVFNKKLRTQNILLLVASYFFYACWDWRFLFLLLFSTALDYFSGLKIEKAARPATRKFWLWLSIGINLGFLGIFKYYNFFAENMSALLSQFGLNSHPALIQVILPVGISFYTFHGLSYIIDIYQRRIDAEKSFVDYSVFVSFFPLLVAGPIERATHLLPQIKRKRSFDYATAVDGCRQILWGLFKKVVIADNCAELANEMFNYPGAHNGSALWLGALFFTFQIYGDFSGYSDIALGTAKLFGIDLLRNFAYPYFSRDIAEFWRRWHISLSSWFRDYVYIPLGGSKVPAWKRIRNTFIIFLLSGFWHGAQWTFIAWGAINAIYFLPLLLTKRNRSNIDIVAADKALPSLRELWSIGITFILTMIAWVFFRAESIGSAFKYLKGMFSSSVFQKPDIDGMGRACIALGLIAIMLLIEWQGRRDPFPLRNIRQRSYAFQYAVYILFILAIFLWAGTPQQFIYFQF
ncbi:MBOAT family O-acyltransferase [Edaphocola aurantiacus]|uniref:MBOAT family O-acyltransferase n=1 Tax=Edaphocola aurantiacus TaxID=2601682 RepID=UPI001C973BF4|nr:MBOAT family O-acyltransferase [Edaphocola aurantiacus]